MGERKVINKYYPPDFDPSKFPRNRKPKHQQINIRMMLPMTIRCVTCYNYIYKGTKFNSCKEDVRGETYLGIPIVRFYFKCTKCSAEIILKTDPQNDGYVIEAGAIAARNIEPRQAEEIHDPMEGLERRVANANRERHIFHTLDELRSMKARRAHVSVDAMREALRGSATVKQEDTLEGEDEVVIKSIFRGSKEFVRRIEDDDDVTNKRKVSREFCDKPRDNLTAIVGKAKKREVAGGRIVLKSSRVKFSVVKKSHKKPNQILSSSHGIGFLDEKEKDDHHLEDNSSNMFQTSKQTCWNSSIFKQRYPRIQRSIKTCMERLRPRFDGANPNGPHRAIAGSVYENFKPIYEWIQEDDHDSLLVYLPGFTKEFIKVTVENPKILHVRGQRLIPGNKWHWFHEDFKVPETCKVNVIRAKFDGGILTITMPHKIINPPTIQEPMKRETQDTKSTKPISSTLSSTITLQPPLNNPTKPSNESKNGHMSLDQAMVRIKEERKVMVKMGVVATTVVAVALVAAGIICFLLSWKLKYRELSKKL